jgi:hypothetical protein
LAGVGATAETRLTPAEREVIEAAKACRAEWRINGRRWDSPVHVRLERAVDALRPMPTLVEQLRERTFPGPHSKYSLDDLLSRAAARIEELEKK